jgi:hypothetical protein
MDFASIVALLMASTLLWNFSMRAAGRAGRGAKGRGAADDRAEKNFDIRDKADKDAVSEFERRMEKFSSKEKEKNDNFKLAMNGARAKKARTAPELEVSICSLTNSPEVVQATGKGRKFLTPSSKQPRESIVRSFINENPDLFGMRPEQVAGLRKIAEYTNPNGKLSWVRMERRWNGIEVFRGETVAAFNSGNEMVRMMGELTSGPEAQSLETSPKVTAAEAVVTAAESLGLTLDRNALTVKETSSDSLTVTLSCG